MTTQTWMGIRVMTVERCLPARPGRFERRAEMARSADFEGVPASARPI
ncbi:hypothetical protein [Nonomuraea dietziae]